MAAVSILLRSCYSVLGAALRSCLLPDYDCLQDFFSNGAGVEGTIPSPRVCAAWPGARCLDTCRILGNLAGDSIKPFLQYDAHSAWKTAVASSLAPEVWQVLETC